MYYTYILVSEKDKKFYTGSTEDMKRRMHEHQEGKVPSTKNRRPLRLMLYEAYPTKTEAQRRERYLKSSDGKKELRIRLSVSLKPYLG